MIKGVCKNIVVLKNVKSKYFESAVFVLKPRMTSKPSKKEMRKEALRIIEEYSDL